MKDTKILELGINLDEVAKFSLFEVSKLILEELEEVSEINLDEVFVIEKTEDDEPILSLEEKLLPKYPGPKTAHFKSLHPDAQQKFRKADEYFYVKTKGKHLKINSGTRTVQKQAQLFRCFYTKQPGCNPANIPGASFHNYGFAIDIINARNSDVIEALQKNGWTRTVMPKEPWHWECSSVSSYNEAKKKLRKMKKWSPPSKARQWQNEIVNGYAKVDKRDKLINTFENKLKLWQPKWAKIQSDIQIFGDDVSDYQNEVSFLKTKIKNFNDKVNKHNNELQKLRKLRTRIERMSPSNERNKLIQRYNKKSQQLQKNGRLIENERIALEYKANEIKNIEQQLIRRKNNIESRYIPLKEEQNILVKMKENIQKIQQEILSHEKKSKSLLKEVAKIVHPHII